MKQLKSNVVILLVLSIVVSYFILKEIFKQMNLSIVDYPKFNYIGKTPKADWYKYIFPVAKQVGKEYGIPWQAIAVQTALETSFGKSSLLYKYNNFAGIKAVKGEQSVQMSTGEFLNGQNVTIIDGFKVWKTPYEGVKGYAEFIHKNKRYKNALNYPNDPFKYLSEVAKAGFATAPTYETLLHTLLNEKYFK